MGSDNTITLGLGNITREQVFNVICEAKDYDKSDIETYLPELLTKPEGDIEPDDLVIMIEDGVATYRQKMTKEQYAKHIIGIYNLEMFNDFIDIINKKRELRAIEQAKEEASKKCVKVSLHGSVE